MVAALTSGNLVGAVKALTRVPKTLEELGVSSTRSTADRMEALQQVADGTADSDVAQARHDERREAASRRR